MFDHIIVGAGINGSSAAYQLAKRGRNVLLLEKVLVHCNRVFELIEILPSFHFPTAGAVPMVRQEELGKPILIHTSPT